MREPQPTKIRHMILPVTLSPDFYTRRACGETGENNGNFTDMDFALDSESPPLPAPQSPETTPETTPTVPGPGSHLASSAWGLFDAGLIMQLDVGLVDVGLVDGGAYDGSADEALGKVRIRGLGGGFLVGLTMPGFHLGGCRATQPAPIASNLGALLAAEEEGQLGEADA